jgi:2,4-dienoyl-CoA reductase-like NADH-dependent reductase (Old Yellow Enzyme family)
LLDQFLWETTKLRDDAYGGSIAKRTRLTVEVVRAIRQAVGPGFPVQLRVSTSEQQNYDASFARTPEELEELIPPLAGAGVDSLHIS